MGLAALPVELLDALVGHIAAPRDLVALASTAHRYSPAAHRALFHTLCLSSAARNLSCLCILAQHPHLALHVRHLTVSIDPRFPPLRPFYSLLARALANTTQLASLSLVLDPTATFALPRHSHRPSTHPHPSHPRYPRLHSFSTNFPLDPNVAAFLAHTPSLTQLQLDPSPPSTSPPSSDTHPVSCSLPSTSVPCLATFCGTPGAAEALAPGRPLASVHLQTGQLSDQTIAALALATTPILMLSAHTDAPPLPVLMSIATHLPSLVYLRLESTDPLTAQPDLAFYARVGKILTALPDLAGFELSGVHFRPEVESSPLSSPRPSPAGMYSSPTSMPLADSPYLGTKIWQTSRPSSPILIQHEAEFDEDGFYDFA